MISDKKLEELNISAYYKEVSSKVSLLTDNSPLINASFLKDMLNEQSLIMNFQTSFTITCLEKII